jgi:hypothetical protein
MLLLVSGDEAVDVMSYTICRYLTVLRQWVSMEC